MEKRYQVFVSSTFADLKEERSKVLQTIMELDCIPAGMEIFPAIDEEQFNFIKRIIDDCDYYILIIGGRYGSVSEEGISYTEMEYEYAISKNIKIIALLHGEPGTLPINKSEVDPLLRDKLEEFRTKASTNRLVKFWKAADELPGLVALSLSKTIKTYPAVGWVRANTSASPELYKELNDLRKENQDLKDSMLIKDETKQLLIPNLAELDDAYHFTGNYVVYDDLEDTYQITPWEVELTWGKLFSLISPYLMNTPNETNIKNTISWQIYYQSGGKNTSGDSEGSPKITEHEFQTIKIHFKALDLISFTFKTSSKGVNEAYWLLTEKGEFKLMELRSAKKLENPV